MTFDLSDPPLGPNGPPRLGPPGYVPRGNGLVILGVDPKVTGSAYAILDRTSAPAPARLLHAAITTGGLRGYGGAIEQAEKAKGYASHLKHGLDVCVVEGQTHRTKGNKSVPANQLKHLTMATGAVLGVLIAYRVARHYEVMDPEDWKGQIQKEPHHKLICRTMGWRWSIDETSGGARRVVPMGTGYNFTPAQWLDVLDAIGIALTY